MKTFLMALLFTLFASSVSAKETPYLNINVGPQMMMAEDPDVVYLEGSGSMIGGRVGVTFDKQLMLFVEYRNISTTHPLYEDDDLDSDMETAQFDYSVGGVGFGLGYFIGDILYTKASVLMSTGSIERDSGKVTKSPTSMSYTFGVGVEFPLMENVYSGIGAEVLYAPDLLISEVKLETFSAGAVFSVSYR